MARAMIRTDMHHLEPPSGTPTLISVVEDESGSRAKAAAVSLLFCFYALRHTLKTTNSRERETPTREQFDI